jgi:hypothetical protein
MLISPVLENDELKGEGPFYICDNCGQLLAKERYNTSKVCPNCEFPTFASKWYAVKLTTALWWYHNTDKWLKKEVGFEEIQDAKIKAICEKVLQKLSQEPEEK